MNHRLIKVRDVEMSEILNARPICCGFAKKDSACAGNSPLSTAPNNKLFILSQYNAIEMLKILQHNLIKLPYLLLCCRCSEMSREMDIVKIHCKHVGNFQRINKILF